MSHFFFHIHADLIKLAAHQTASVNRDEITPVHYGRYMMACNASPIRYPCRTMLISPGVSAIRIPLNMPYQNGNIAVINIFIYIHRILAFRHAQINHMFLIFAVMAEYLSGMPELIKNFFSQYCFCILRRTLRMQSVGDNK